MRPGKVFGVVFGVFVALVFAAGSVHATVINVPADHPKVQLAIDAAGSGDTVQVAAGTYAPSTNGEAFPINMKNGVRLLGAGAEACTLDAEQTNRVIACQWITDTKTKIEGFTITNALPTGGITVSFSSPTITNNVITGNSAAAGGGIAMYSSSPTITNNIITGNSAFLYGGGISCRSSSPTITNNVITENSVDFRGGGICCDDESNPTVTNNVITDNRAGWSAGGISCRSSSPTITDNVITGNTADRGQGGGICCDDESNPAITNNVITENSTREYGGGISCKHGSSPIIMNNVIAGNSANYSGGGISCSGSNPTITNNVISGNTSYSGGGISCRNEPNPTITNNVITGNSASGDYGWGGGISCSGSNPTITNNVITGNSASGGNGCGGGISCRNESNPTITNNVVTENNSGDKGGGIFCYDSSPTITYDDVWGNTPNDYYGCGSGTGCISADPLFVDISASDYHLQSGSPCVDTGNNDAPGLPEFDFDGNPRIMDGDGDGIAVVDMGPFEFRLSKNQPRAIKEDAVVELEDLKPTGDPKLDKKIDKIIRHIEKSLKDKLWKDEDHLDPKHGKKVFDEEKKAAKDLMKQLRKRSVPDSIKVVFSAVTVKLLDADEILAQTAIDDAIAGGGKPKEIEKAEKEMEKAQKDWDKGKYDKAIKHYKKAWEHAQKAMKKHKKPKHEQLAVHHRGVPKLFLLLQNYPNPVTNSTTIAYTLAKDCHVTLEVHNTAGQKVMALVNEEQGTGYRSVSVDTDMLSAGVYFYRLKAGDYQASKKMIVLR